MMTRQIHRHEIPRKVLHVSIGFFSIYLYTSGVQPPTLTPILFTALIPIASVDFLRHRFPSLNRTYVRVLGALMRESEVDGWNGVVWYLLGAYIALRCFPKDIGMMSVLLLSWCDTAASTVGRAYGRYTPRVRKGKSLAGSLAAFVVGVGAAAAFWGWLVPRTGPLPGDDINPFMFNGVLRLPYTAMRLLGWASPGDDTTSTAGSISGGLALGVMSLWTGLMGAVSEVVDLAGCDDNLTIPVLSAVGLWGFLKVFT
jgi:diacylglycerol kinase (CTP)